MEMKMQIMTARDAKTRFGEALDTMQKEPVLITKNNRPVGVLVSLDDLKGTYLADHFIAKADDYDEWLVAKVGATIKRLTQEGSKGKSADEVHASVMDKVRLRLSIKK